MSTREKILAAVLVIFFVCVAVWVVRTTPTEPPPIEKVDPPTVVEYEGNTIVEEKDGQIIWELTCDKMLIDSVTQNVELDNLIWKFYQHDKDMIWNLTAAKGIYYRKEENMHVEGEIVLTNSDGAELLSDNLDWFAKQGMLTATGEVIITNNDGAKLLSDKVDWLTDEEKVIATGNVRISKDDMRAFGDMAYSDNDFKHFGLMGHARVLKGVGNSSGKCVKISNQNVQR